MHSDGTCSDVMDKKLNEFSYEFETTQSISPEGEIFIIPVNTNGHTPITVVAALSGNSYTWIITNYDHLNGNLCLHNTHHTATVPSGLKIKITVFYYV